MRIVLLLIRIFLGTMLLCAIIIITDSGRGTDDPSHNCRVWGFICTTMNDSLEEIVGSHLDSLQQLGYRNPDGWGIGYYVQPETTFLPVINRGEPSAPLDPRYTIAVGNAIDHMTRCAVAHVRKGSSGPTSGIPDPHPFYRSGTQRHFEMLFAHNGTLPAQLLYNLIVDLDPGYLTLNPPDYNPNYLDSDLYAIYIMETIDIFQDSSIEACIAYAITSIDSALGPLPGEFNYVMTDGHTLWAFCYTHGASPGFTMYYYPGSIFSNYWIAASEQLDSLAHEWHSVPESTLVVLTPGEPPVHINVFTRITEHPVSSAGLDVIYPNPFFNTVDIRYSFSGHGPLYQDVTIKIFDVTGRLIRAYEFPQHYAVFSGVVRWDGTDARGARVPAGIYVCQLVGDVMNDTQKIIYIK